MKTAPPILIIDDNRDLAENLQEILEDEDIAAEIALSAEGGLALLEAGDYGMVITDVRMPGMDGVELLETVHQRWPRLPVVVMTAFANDIQSQRAAAAGALEILSKPLDMGHILGLIERVSEPHAPVLVLEDDAALRSNLCEVLLEIADAVPHAAPDIATARRLVDELDFRVAIIDARLPDGDGLDFGRELHERFGQEIALFYITGYAAELAAKIQELLCGEQVHLLEKPFPPNRLLTLIKEAV